MLYHSKSSWVSAQIQKALSALDSDHPNIDLAIQTLKVTDKLLRSSCKGPILLVDTDGDFVDLISEVFEEDGIEVSCAQNASDALTLSAKYRQEKTPFVVAIIGLKGEAGKGPLAILHQLRKDHPNVRIILSSGNLAEATVVSTDNEYFWGQLSKPYSISEIRTLVESALAV